jgi:DNA (cytosine-5)-methyltransferase 1
MTSTPIPRLPADRAAERARRTKLARLRAGATPRVLELASGCGGLALGLKRAGFELTAHIEVDPEAAETYRVNFGPDRDAKWSAVRDMAAVGPAALAEELALGEPALAIDILAAGLPCQAFARIGRSKLRDVSGDGEAYKNDARSRLYLRFLEFVEGTAPLVVVLENVPDILNHGGHNVPEEIAATLASKGYAVRYTILNAAHHGVPQIRERLFLVAFARELGAIPGFPEPSHHLELPKGYEGSRRVALKHVPADSPWFVPLKNPDPALPAAVTVKQALADLPLIRDHQLDPGSMRRRSLDEKIASRRPAGRLTYAAGMRHWPGVASAASSTGHKVRMTPRDYETFLAMAPGADYPQALKVAEARLAAALATLDAGEASEPRTVERLRASIVPPYDVAKFPNRWWKLDPRRPSRTLTAHLGKDGYSHIHYDGEQARAISVREAARLQSFPDGFRFSGTMNAAFKQIGNAVSPLLAWALGKSIWSQLAEAVKAPSEAA